MLGLRRFADAPPRAGQGNQQDRSYHRQQESCLNMSAASTAPGWPEAIPAMISCSRPMMIPLKACACSKLRGGVLINKSKLTVAVSYSFLSHELSSSSTSFWVCSLDPAKAC